MNPASNIKGLVPGHSAAADHRVVSALRSDISNAPVIAEMRAAAKSPTAPSIVAWALATPNEHAGRLGRRTFRAWECKADAEHEQERVLHTYGYVSRLALVEVHESPVVPCNGHACPNHLRPDNAVGEPARGCPCGRVHCGGCSEGTYHDTPEPFDDATGPMPSRGVIPHAATPAKAACDCGKIEHGRHHSACPTQATPELCLVTHNPVGVDTWSRGYACMCGPCQRMIAGKLAPKRNQLTPA